MLKSEKNDVNELPLEDQIGEIVDRFAERLESGQMADVESFLGQYPEHSELLRPLLNALFEIENGSIGETVLGASKERRLGDYRIIREIGRGGMGVVYQAEQVSLGREVALKVLPFASMIDAKPLERFRNEVRAAASLEHPHIVSVYAVGEERGVHFYAMQLIRGQSLAAVIRELQLLRQADGQLSGSSISEVMARSGESTNSEFDSNSDDERLPGSRDDERGDDEPPVPEETQSARCDATQTASVKSTSERTYYCNVARLGIQAAEALAHAHEQGVIHRDIKPGNLMLDSQGQIFVTDFGLARIEAAGVTMTGDWLGTPRYMSPEQALGRQVVVDHRADIYSMGVTLYELLTLRPAFDAADRQALLRQIANDEPPKPRSLDSRIPHDLETIVLKAINKERDERYTTANELAEDLQRLLDDKPILAKPLTLLQRTTKWAVRHKPLVATATVALLLAVIGLAISNLLIAGQRNIAKQQRDEAQRQKQRADENFRRAQAVVDQYLTSVSEENLLNAAAMQPLRKELLELALDYYQEFIKELGDEQELRAELAAAYFRVGEITNLIGSKDKAIEAHQTALAIRQILVDEQSSRVEPKSELAESYSRLGQLQMEVGKNKEAQELHSRAIDISSMLVSSVPDNRDYRARLAWAHHQAAQLADAPADAKFEHASKAVAEFEKLTADHPDVPEYWHKLAWSYNTLGRHQATSAGRIAYFEKALGTQQKLVDEHSEVAQYRHRLALYYYNRALFTEHGSSLRNDLINKSVSISERLVEENPSVVEYLNALARSYTLVFVNLTYRGDYDQALAIGQKEVEIRESLVKDNPNVNGYQFPLAMTLSRIAQLHELRDDVEDAVDCHRHAAQIFEQLATKNPELGPYLHNAGFGYLDSAKVFFRNRRYAETVDACRQALRCGKQLLDRNPKYPSVVHAESLVWLSRAQRKLQLVDEADASIDTVIQMMLDIPEDERQQRHWCTLGVAHYYRNRWADAHRALETAIQKRGSFDLWDNRHWHLPMALHQMGETQKAREAYDDAVKNLKQFGVGERAMADKHRKEAAKVLGIETEEVLENGDRSKNGDRSN